MVEWMNFTAYFKLISCNFFHVFILLNRLKSKVSSWKPDLVSSALFVHASRSNFCVSFYYIHMNRKEKVLNLVFHENNLLYYKIFI